MILPGCNTGYNLNGKGMDNENIREGINTSSKMCDHESAFMNQIDFTQLQTLANVGCL